MSDTIIVIAGVPCNNKINLENQHKLQKVPCPHCLKQMMLSNAKLKAIYIHYFINDKNEFLDVMCLNCIEEQIEEHNQSPFGEVKKIRLLSVE